MTSIANIISMLFMVHVIVFHPDGSIHQLRYSERPQRSIAPLQINLLSPITTTQSLTTTKLQRGQATSGEIYHRVAARSLGEGPSALAEIACTVKNRLRVSGSPLPIVLRAYFAHDRPPRPEHIEIVRKVFEGELPCPETWWYALSPQDTRRFRPHAQPVVMITSDPSDPIWIYDR